MPDSRDKPKRYDVCPKCGAEIPTDVNRPATEFKCNSCDALLQNSQSRHFAVSMALVGLGFVCWGIVELMDYGHWYPVVLIAFGGLIFWWQWRSMRRPAALRFVESRENTSTK